MVKRVVLECNEVTQDSMGNALAIPLSVVTLVGHYTIDLHVSARLFITS